MHQITFGDTKTGICAKTWRADVPTLTRPPISVHPIEIDGVKHYEGPGGKLYIAEQFDRMFKPAVSVKMNLRAKRDTAGRITLNQF